MEWDEEQLGEDTESVVETQGTGGRLDVLLAECSDLTRSRIAGLIREGRCTVDGKTVTKPGCSVSEGAAVMLRIPLPRPIEPQPQNLPLSILYEDADIAVINKACGMVVHPAAGNEDGTVVNALLYHLRDLSSIGGAIRPGIVHRLDKETSGILLVAKNDAAQLHLSSQFQSRTTEKHYLALVEGDMKEESGEVCAPLARSHQDYKKMAIDEKGRPAVTQWRVMARGRGCTLLDVHILTGRTHQIRVHMRSLQHPVCGDALYGFPRGVRVPRMMLHAWWMAFDHPSTGERMTVEAPISDEFVTGLENNGLDASQVIHR